MKKRRTLRTTHQTTRTAAMPNRAAARDGGDVAVWSAVFHWVLVASSRRA
jgi:hypothetical protein